MIDDDKQGIIKIQMKYGAEKERVINGIKRFQNRDSRFTLRVMRYKGVGGLGIAIIPHPRSSK